MWYYLLFFILPLVLSDSCPVGYTECSENKCFMAVQQNKTWPRALRHCTQTGGTLAVITSISQNDCVNGLTSGQSSPYWIGLVQIGDSGWQWIDGSEMSFSKWSPEKSEEDYPFATFSPSSATWLTEKSGVIFGQYYICSAVPTQCNDD